MCTFPTAPPTLSFFWPWQAPGNWLLFGLIFAAFVAVLVRLYRRPRWTAQGTQRDLVFAFSVAGYTVVIACMVLTLAVLEPSSSTFFTWADNQGRWAYTHQCSQDLDTIGRLMESTYGSLGRITAVGVLAGVLVPIVGLVVQGFHRAPEWLRQRWEMRSAPR